MMGERVSRVGEEVVFENVRNIVPANACRVILVNKDGLIRKQEGY